MWFLFAFSNINWDVPKGFRVEKGDDHVVQLHAPERTLKIFVLEMEGQDLKKAIDDALAKILPDLKQDIKDIQNAPSSEWDEKLSITYKEGSLVEAKRIGNKIYVFIKDGPKPQLKKRQAQIATFFKSVKGKIEDVSKTAPAPIKADDLDCFIKHVMQKSHIPGIAIAVVENGEIAFVKGYGLRHMECRDKIDENTQLRIASITKSMTTLMMDRLVNEGKFKWRTKAYRIYPPFHLADRKLTKRLTMEHLVSNSTGVPRKDFSMMYTLPALTHPENKLFSVVATLTPTTKLGETYQYQNQLVASAGFIAAYADNPTEPMYEHYINLMKQHVFDPIGMERASFVPIDKNHAYPHALFLDHKQHPVDDRLNLGASYDMAPAGGIWASIKDMARYLRYEIHADDPIRRKPGVKVSGDTAYGLGWFMGKHKGVAKVYHFGAVFGFSSMMSFYPDKKCGIVILANSWLAHPMIEIIEDRIFEMWFNTDEKAEQKLKFEGEKQDCALDNIRKSLVNDAQWMNHFVGQHENKEFGTVLIEKKNGNYVLHMADYDWKIAAYEKNGVRVIKPIEPPTTLLELIPTENNSFKIREAQHEYVFEKR